MASKLPRLLLKPGAWIALAFSLLIVIIALGGYKLMPFTPLGIDTDVRFQGPSFLHWMGTDNLGRDIASRTLAGTGMALQSCLIILVSATVIGLLVGCVSGYYGGLVDEVLMRISDVFIAFPGLVPTGQGSPSRLRDDGPAIDIDVWPTAGLVAGAGAGQHLARRRARDVVPGRTARLARRGATD